MASNQLMNRIQARVQAPMPARMPQDLEISAAAEVIVGQCAARAISLLSRPSMNGEGGDITRPSANDCYAALEEATRKMARVAVRKHSQMRTGDRLPLAQCLNAIFPDPAAYLACAIRSVIRDAGRMARREPQAISLETPLTSDAGEGALRLVDTITESREDASPELSLMQRDERMGFRTTLAQAIGRIPQNYLEALKRDIARERTKEHGSRLQPMSDQERQTLCRARAALAVILRKECGDDNPYIRLLNQQRNSRVKRKENPATSLSGQRQEALLRKLLDTGWVVRSSERVDDSVEEAVVNYVHTASPAAPPSPEFRQSMRVLDLYKMDFPTPRTSPATELYARARASREAGQLEDALRCYKACFDAEPTFTEALSEVGVMHSQMGNLRDALKIYLSIVERNASGEHRCRAATNASDIYLTWFDAGRQREKNIELAIKYALMAMERPTPMRACNLILAYAKDRFFEQARDVLHDLLDRKLAECPTDRLLQTLFQIRDSDLVIWWDWLDTELEKG